jgi:hypothetical protein
MADSQKNESIPQESITVGLIVHILVNRKIMLSTYLELASISHQLAKD